MKSKAALVIAWCLLGSPVVFGQAGGQDSPPAETTAPDIPGVVAGGTKVQLIKEGLQGTEGPIPTPDGSLLLTEQDANKIIKMDKDGKFSTYAENTNRTVGLAYDPKGRLIGTAQGGQVIVFTPVRSVLADTFGGQTLSRPNDLVIDKKGGVYFTDPIPANVAPGQKPPPAGRKPAVFYIRPTGQLIMGSDEFERPNGIILSPDEKILYVTNGEYLIAFDVQPDGSIRNRRTFVTLVGLGRNADGTLVGAADGLVIDAAGRVYAATGPGVQVFSPQGQYLGTIPIPRPPQNLTFGGPDKKTLYVVGRGAVYKIAMRAQGFKGRAR